MAEQFSSTETSQPTAPGAAELPVISWLFILLAGVVLPAFTLGFEAVTQSSAQSFFDPIPNLPHAMLIALVPLANAWLLIELARSRPASGRAGGWLVACATGIAAFYAVLYLPLTPLAAFAIIFGVGLLPLAPLLSLLAAWRGRTLLNRRRLAQGLPRLLPVWRGMVLVLLALVLINLPFTLTRIGLHMATAAEPARQQSGIRWLRAAGDENFLRQLCYSRSGLSTDLIGTLFSLGDPVTTEEARSIYYRVTGNPFNEKPAPSRKGLRDWDRSSAPESGGQSVGGRQSGVSLAASRLDGSLDAKASLAYLEWTMVFRNRSAVQQEGRARIALPPGAVVSRLTLWIDGEEREAAFGTRNQTRQAYQKVVSRQRDPVLVTTAGRDRIMLQLFPIPPGGGEMKVRLGLTMPLVVNDFSRARLQLPSFRERNFDIAPGFSHAIWLESGAPLPGTDQLRHTATGSGHALRGEIEDGSLSGAAGQIDIPRNPAVRIAWSDDTVAGKDRVVVQHYRERLVEPPRRLALVVDASRSLAAVAGDISAALPNLPGPVEIALFPASDQSDMPAGPMSRQQAAKALRQLPFSGGQDNQAALLRAWDWAAGDRNGAILWIHGPQPVIFGNIEAILQRAERQPGRVRLYSLEAVPGPNQLLEALERLPGMTVLRRNGDLQQDIVQRFAAWAPGSTEILVQRESLASGAILRERATRTSEHLARLWAAEQIDRWLEHGSEHERQQASELALRYRLVTPVSGAVVLETASQYEETGLTPVDKGSVPTVPEPEEWMLMATSLILLLWMMRRQRNHDLPGLT